MKRISIIFSVLMVAAMLLAACGPKAAAPAEKTVLNVWSFTNEIMTMAVAFEKDHPDVDVVYTMIPMTNGEYQTKLMATWAPTRSRMWSHWKPLSSNNTWKAISWLI